VHLGAKAEAQGSISEVTDLPPPADFFLRAAFTLLSLQGTQLAILCYGEWIWRVAV